MTATGTRLPAAAERTSAGSEFPNLAGGARIAHLPRRRRLPVAAARAIYDGREYLGEVAELGSGQFEASLPDGTSLGLSDDRVSAEHALLAATRRRSI